MGQEKERKFNALHMPNDNIDRYDSDNTNFNPIRDDTDMRNNCYPIAPDSKGRHKRPNLALAHKAAPLESS